MRALKLRIEKSRFITKNWSYWKREDQDYIQSKAGYNNVECFEVEDEDTMLFIGTPENLFNFMYDVAYRYDIEII